MEGRYDMGGAVILSMPSSNRDMFRLVAIKAMPLAAKSMSPSSPTMQ